MKKYRYQKVTPEILENMKDLRAKGMTYKEIAKKLKLSASNVGYWLNPEIRIKEIERGKDHYANLTKKQKKEHNYKSQEYRNSYYPERYKTDEEFRKRMITLVLKSYRKRSKEWRKKDLCSNCGRKRKNKDYKQCENCREKARKRYLK